MTDLNDISVKKERRAIGVLMLLLPYIQMLGTWSFPPSLSDTHYMVMGGVFDGFMVLTAGFFLWAPAYSKGEYIAFKIAAVCCFAVALFPCNMNPADLHTIISRPDNTTRDMVHHIAAGLLFVTVAYICIFQFTKPIGYFSIGDIDRKECSIMMGIFIIICLLTRIFFHAPTLLIETIAFNCFGFAFLVNARVILKDE